MRGLLIRNASRSVFMVDSPFDLNGGKSSPYSFRYRRHTKRDRTSSRPEPDPVAPLVRPRPQRSPRRPERQKPNCFSRRKKMERETGFEPATNSLEGCDSTPELLPLAPCRMDGGGGRIRTRSEE